MTFFAIIGLIFWCMFFFALGQELGKFLDVKDKPQYVFNALFNRFVTVPFIAGAVVLASDMDIGEPA